MSSIPELRHIPAGDLPQTIEELAPLFRTRALSPVEVIRACLHRIETFNPRLRAYVTVLADGALEQAKQAERELLRGVCRSPLHGVPVSVKDVFATKGIPTTWGAQALATYRPAQDATVVVKLREAGAILLGKANVDTIPYDGGSDGPRLAGPTCNPWDTERTAGRSSGGSAAAVAAAFDYGSIGTDSGGSIRIPAALCGVVGFKPTYGLVSRHKVFPYSYSFDHAGPLARSVYDCALLLGVIAGRDPKDPTTVDLPVPDYVAGLNRSVHGLRLGVPRRAAWGGNDPEVTGLVDAAVTVLAGLGLAVRDIDLPYIHEAHWVMVGTVLEMASAVEALAPAPQFTDPYVAYLANRNGAARRRVLQHAMEVHRAAKERYAEVFRDVDLIVTPTVPIKAPRFADARSPWQLPNEPFSEILARYTRLFNLIGSPAISLPCGLAADLPVALQLAGRPFEDDVVLRAAYAFEHASGWTRRRPPIVQRGVGVSGRPPRVDNPRP